MQRKKPWKQRYALGDQWVEEVIPHLSLKNAQVLTGEAEKRDWQAKSSTDTAIFQETVNLTKLTGLEILELEGPVLCAAMWSDIFWELTKPVLYQMSPQAYLKMNLLKKLKIFWPESSPGPPLGYLIQSNQPWTLNTQPKNRLSRLYL